MGVSTRESWKPISFHPKSSYNAHSFAETWTDHYESPSQCTYRKNEHQMRAQRRLGRFVCAIIVGLCRHSQLRRQLMLGEPARELVAVPPLRVSPRRRLGAAGAGRSAALVPPVGREVAREAEVKVGRHARAVHGEIKKLGLSAAASSRPQHLE